jgi:hypothetical protein
LFSIDIGLAMGLGHRLRFARDADLSWSPQITHPHNHPHKPARFPELAAAIALHSRPDPRLLHVWADLRNFSAMVNDAAARGDKVPIETASQVATSVPYRLLRLKGDERQESLHELLRLCLLSYAKMLLIKLPGIGRQMTVLVEGLKGALVAWCGVLQRWGVGDGGGVSGDPAGVYKLLLWGAFVASVAIFEDFDEEWLNDILLRTVVALGLQDWPETRAVLKDFLWIDIVFDQPAERLFRRLSPEDGGGTTLLEMPGG